MSITDHGITVTIKYGKAYDDSWAVFKGPNTTDVRFQILEYFGVSDDDTIHLTLHELVTDVTKVAQGTATAARVLDAVAINPNPRETNIHPWAGLKEELAAEAAVHPHQRVLDLIGQQTSIDDLRAVYAKNQAAFADEEVMDAYKARGKELLG